MQLVCVFVCFLPNDCVPLPMVTVERRRADEVTCLTCLEGHDWEKATG